MKHARIFLRAASLLLCLLFVCVPLSVSAQEAQAESSPLPSMQEAGAVYLYHIQSETPVLVKGENLLLPAGSTVKILSGLIFCEALDGRLQDAVPITKEMELSQGLRLGLRQGDILSVEQLLYAALCGSNNDAYYALACYVSGNVEAFVGKMNLRAAELGLKSSHFTDPSGVVDGSVITASELAKIALVAEQNSLYMTITGTAKYTMAPTLMLKAQTITNRNELIASTTTTKYYNSRCRGMSAGWTSQAGSCVVTVATHENETYLSIVLDGENTAEQNYGYIVTNRIIDWVYATYSYMEVISPDGAICFIPVTVSDVTSEIPVRAKESLFCYLPRGVELGRDVTYSIRLTHPSLEAPVTEDTFVGYVAVLYDGRVLGTLPLYTAGSAQRSGLVSRLKDIESLMQNRRLVSGAIFFAVVLAAWIITEQVLVSRRRKRWNKYFSGKTDLYK